MAKKQTKAVLQPKFEAGIVVSQSDYPVVVTDSYGQMWRIEPHSGEARPVKFIHQ